MTAHADDMADAAKSYNQSSWPKRPDGTNMTMGEMTPEQRREQTAASLQRIKTELESPAIQHIIQNS